MARYIEANDLVRKMTLQANRTMLGEITTPHLSYSEMLEIIADAPTADVAPKSEVAREIFGEIDWHLRKFWTSFFIDAPQSNYDRHIEGLFELKKKYTEGADNEQREA